MSNACSSFAAFFLHLPQTMLKHASNRRTDLDFGDREKSTLYWGEGAKAGIVPRVLTRIVDLFCSL